MAEIRPFKGILYNQNIVNDLRKVVAPPYDVISAQDRQILLAQSEYNSVRLILPEKFATDTEENNCYTRAANLFHEWLRRGVLLREKTPCMYVYKQEYQYEGEKRERIGFIALAKLENYNKGVIKGHERTLKEPKRDRLNLMRACRANFSQVFTLFSDPIKKVDQILNEATIKNPLIDITVNEERNILWRLDDHNSIKQLQEILADKQLFIGDGHHRYETALAFRDEMRQLTGDTSGSAPFDYIMVMLVNMEDPNITILPTHRIIKNIFDFKPEKVLQKLHRYFEINQFKTVTKLMEEMRREVSKNVFGLYLKDGHFYFLKLKQEVDLDKEINTEHSPEWKRLDVSILHHLILDQLLSLPNTSSVENIDFTSSVDEALRAVEDNRAEMAFILNPTSINSVKLMANKSEAMPQKSTYFYPKLLSGLVFNLLEW
jgi:uncharacterized protein (DUF1015 family)